MLEPWGLCTPEALAPFGAAHFLSHTYLSTISDSILRDTSGNFVIFISSRSLPQIGFERSHFGTLRPASRLRLAMPRQKICAA
jgi:DNA-directed RNA polymerase specialized sigma54-like protein